jgi:hypothetical protein
MPTPTPPIVYPFDPTGQLIGNRITGEQHTITSSNYRDYHFIVPINGPYFEETLVISHRDINNNVRILNKGIDYQPTHWFVGASRACAKAIYGSISFLDLQLSGTVTLQYQTIGGEWTLDLNKISQILADRLHNPKITAWEMVSGKPTVFPPVNHEWNLTDLVGVSDLVAAVNNVTTALIQSQTDGFAAHINAVNPHGTTAASIGAISITQLENALHDLGFSTADELYFLGRS